MNVDRTITELLAIIGDKEVQIYALRRELVKVKAELATKEKAHGDAA